MPNYGGHERRKLQKTALWKNPRPQRICELLARERYDAALLLRWRVQLGTTHGKAKHCANVP